MLRLTQLFNVTGHPALAMPAAVGKDRLPRSIQLVGSRTSQLLSIARDVEPHISRRRRIGWRRHRLNVRTIRNVRLSRWNRPVHGRRMLDDIRRMRHVRSGWLF